MTPAMLEKLNDDELRQLIEHSRELLADRDRERKSEAMELARKTLEGVGLSLKDLVSANQKADTRKRNRPAVTPYRAGFLYRNPDNSRQEWIGRGKKPGWLRDLERRGGTPIEVRAPDNLARVKESAPDRTTMAHDTDRPPFAAHQDGNPPEARTR